MSPSNEPVSDAGEGHPVMIVEISLRPTTLEAEAVVAALAVLGAASAAPEPQAPAPSRSRWIEAGRRESLRRAGPAWRSRPIGE